MVVFRGDENIAVVLSDLLLPAHAFSVLGRNPGVAGDLVEEREGMVAQVDQVELHVVSLFGDVVDPLPGLVAKSSGAGGGQNDGDFRLAHGSVPSKCLTIHMIYVRNTLSHRNMGLIMHHDNRQNCGTYDQSRR